MTVVPPEPDQGHTFGFLGRLGQRVTLTGIVTAALWVNGFNSSPSRLLILNCGSAVAKTVTPASWAATVHTGDQLTITGTVKKHEEWHGTPQTLLARTRLQDPARAAADALKPGWEIVRGAGPRRRFPDPSITSASPLAPRLTS